MNEVVVVEGKSDTQAIQRAVDADTIETNGSALPPHILTEIKRAMQHRGVIIFTDPDSAGERIRRLISEEIPGVKHAFLPHSLARNKHRIGVEYASKAAIVQALNAARSSVEHHHSPYVHPLPWEEYLDLGFTGRPDSVWFREQVAKQLGIGYGNAKQFYRRLMVLRVTRDELFQAISQVKRG